MVNSEKVLLTILASYLTDILFRIIFRGYNIAILPDKFSCLLYYCEKVRIKLTLKSQDK